MTAPLPPTTDAELVAAVTAKEQILGRLEHYAKSKNVLGYYGPGDSFIDQGAVTAIASLLDRLDQLSAEVAELRESLHYANGVAGLALKHQDAAEAEAAGLRKALERLDRLFTYPVAQEINPQGYGVREARSDANEFAAEIIRASLTPRMEAET